MKGLAVCLALLAGTPVYAQQAVNSQQVNQGGFGAPQGGPPLPGGRGAPPGGVTPRDGRGPALTGTSTIRGRVFAADTGRPLRRARINVSAPELGQQPVTTSTGVDGRYEVKELPAGRYTVAVNRSGYLNLRYGQRRPFEQGKPVQISDKQVVDNIDFSLPKMSVISGRLFDETGDPISGVRVFAMRSVYFEGKRRFVPVGGGPVGQTDDAGQYRLLGLPPGNYYVMADLRETWTTSEGGVQQTLGYAPTYFPGTTNIADARRVTVGVGQEASNNDYALIPGRAASVSGTALDSQGRPLAGRAVQVGQEWRGPGFGMAMFGASGGQTTADGSFRVKDLAPGDYTFRVNGGVEINGATVQESASAMISVNGVDLDNVMLASVAGASANGQVVMDTGQPPTVSRDRIRLVGRPLVPQGFGGPAGNNPDSGRVKDDWTFTISGLVGQNRIRANVPDSVMVKAILQDGRDVTDYVFDLRSGDTIAGLQVVLTTRVSSVTGQLTDDKGAPLPDGTILVFANDPIKWTEDSRFIKAVRPDQQGRYEVRGLPAGEYLAVAIDYVEEGTWNDPEYLESIRRSSQRVAVGEGDVQTVALKLLTSAP